MPGKKCTLLWSCWPQAKAPTPGKRLIIDLDETLLVVHNSNWSTLLDEIYPHLTLISNYDYLFYIIYLEQTAAMFKEILQMNDVEICFMTAASMHTKEILLVLEQAYGLPLGSLYLNCRFFNKVSDCTKGYKIRTLINKNTFHKNDFILLLDDQRFQTESIEEQGFTAVQATGFLYKAVEDAVYIITDPNYLTTVVQKIQAAKIESPDIKTSTSTLTLAPRML